MNGEGDYGPKCCKMWPWPQRRAIGARPVRKIDPPAPSVERPWSHEERKPDVSRREEDTISRFPEAMESALAVRVVFFPLDEE